MLPGISIFNFSGVYDEESFYRPDKGSSFYDVKYVDLKGIPGTNCMCDDDARKEILRIMEDNHIGANELHFIDSGNYHYMSALLTGLVKEPFSLVVLDHHPDMLRPMFDILSCGGWVLDVLEKNEYLQEVHIVGADKRLIDELDENDRNKVSFYDGSAMDEVDPRYPVYLSIDKDVVSRGELITNWDQGKMRALDLFDFVKELNEKHRIIGVDVCGECATDQEDYDVAGAIKGNDEFNRKILELPLESLSYAASSVVLAAD